MKTLIAIVLMAFLFAETGGSPIPFTATAYTLKGLTASGHRASRGIVAADTRVLPLGTQIHIEGGEYTGNYIVRDTGNRIKGHKLDIWVSSVREARRFGRRVIKVTIIDKSLFP